ncbi:MAG: hypothetical protein JO233_00885, partial [Candidatus Eremiobacteraeota bacterium]|nr:hypothetical protein [Candidatus Eremiobacteraeota bacterium]
MPVAIAGITFGFLLVTALGGTLNVRHLKLSTILTVQLFGYLFVLPYVLFVLRGLWRG